MQPVQICEFLSTLVTSFEQMDGKSELFFLFLDRAVAERHSPPSPISPCSNVRCYAKTSRQGWSAAKVIDGSVCFASVNLFRLGVVES